MAEFKKGWLAGSMLSADEDSESFPSAAEVAFGAGASGRADLGSDTGRAAAVWLAETTAEFSRGLAAWADSWVQQRTTRAENSKDHLSCCRPGEGSEQAATVVHLTVPPDRCHWSIGHGRSGTLPLRCGPRGFWNLGTGPFLPAQESAGKNCYNAAREMFRGHQG